MGIQALQRFIEAHCVPVDLLKIARTVRRSGCGRTPYRQSFFPYNRLCLVVDGECCLDRLYGGYFSDWVCGGQWNRMVQFLSVLIQTVQNNNIELVVFFDGGLEPQRIDEWVKEQQADRKKINQVIKHVSTKATPPPKVWWIPPACLRTCLRMALRHLNVTVMCSMDDHHQEVIAFCRENNFHGLMAEDAEYAVFDPPRYFSSEQLKLTYKGSLETKEFILDEVAKSLNLHPNRFCVFAALLGNYLLTEDDLTAFHKLICPDNKGSTDALISAVVNFVRSLASIDNLDAIGAQVFGATDYENIQKFKHCVQYYLNGTSDGFLRYRPTMQGRRPEPGCYPAFKNLAPISEQPKQQSSQTPKGENAQLWGSTNNSATTSSPSLSQDSDAFPAPTDPSRFASETAESELSSLTAYREATSAYNSAAPQIVIDPPNHSQLPLDLHAPMPKSQNDANHQSGKYPSPANNSAKSNGEVAAAELQQPPANSSASSNSGHVNGGLLLSSSSSSSSSSPNRLSPEVAWSTAIQQNKGKHPTDGGHVDPALLELPRLPKVPPEVMRTASERHQKGLMSPWIYQILSQGEIKIPVSVEDEFPRELPSPGTLFRPLRQMVYAILFNLHHLQFMARQKKEREGKEEIIGEIIVKEWVWNKQNQFRCPDLVLAQPLDWGVPTVQRLWFGSTVDDKKRRIRAFLSCMRSDAPLILNTSYVPQHLLVMCCVLRYVMTEANHPILRKQELDAFLAQSVSPYLMNAQYTQNMQLPLVTPRGIELAALFMQGVECALFANDACGAPIPWLMCCPWLFFDGKLFHFKLLKANGAKSLIDVCDGQLDQVAKVDRMRTAILEGIQVQFARPPLVPMPPQQRPGGVVPSRFRGPSLVPVPPPPHPHFGGRGRGRGVMAAPPVRPERRGLIARGGQLEIAGVVVGSWGANYGQVPRPRSLGISPQVTAVPSGMRRVGPPMPTFGRAFPPRRPTVPARIRPTPIFAPMNKRKTKTLKPKLGKDVEESNNKNGMGRGCTIETVDNKTIQLSQLISGNGNVKQLANDQFAHAENDASTVIPAGEKDSSRTVQLRGPAVAPPLGQGDQLP